MSSAEPQSEVLDLLIGADGSGIVDAVQLARLGVERGTHLSVVPVAPDSGGGAPRLSARSPGRLGADAERGRLPGLQFRRCPGLGRSLPRRRCLGHVDPVRVVADTHAVVWYLLVVDLWYVIRTRGTFTDDQLDQVVRLLRDPESTLEAEPVTLDVTAGVTVRCQGTGSPPGPRSAARGNFR